MSIALDIREHEPWVMGLAKRFDRKGAGLKDDLYQEGMIGLMQAANRFDPAMNKSFKRYACARVRGAMVDWLRRFLPGPRPQHGPFRAVFIDSLDREIPRVSRSNQPLTSGNTVGIDGSEAKRRLRMLCKEILTAREFRIIQHVYFERGTARELRVELGISESQISHNHSMAKEKLRKAIGTADEMEIVLEGTVGGRKVTGAHLSPSGRRGYQRRYHRKVTKSKKKAIKR